MLEKILPTAEIIPAVDQVCYSCPPWFQKTRLCCQLELHLYNPQLKLLEYLRSKEIVPQAYSPLGSTNSPLFADEVATEIARKYGLQTADVLLGYLRKFYLIVLMLVMMTNAISQLQKTPWCSRSRSPQHASKQT